MVIFVIYAIYVLPGANERYAPVAAHLHGPRAFSGAAEFMEIQAGQVHIARAGSGVQTAEDEAEPVSVLCLNSRLGPGGEEPFDSFVSKPFDRRAYECNLHGYRLQPARPGGRGVPELRSMDRCLAASIPQAWRGGKFPPTRLAACAGRLRSVGTRRAGWRLSSILRALSACSKMSADSEVQMNESGARLWRPVTAPTAKVNPSKPRPAPWVSAKGAHSCSAPQKSSASTRISSTVS
jgi:hypothetical protein